MIFKNKETNEIIDVIVLSYNNIKITKVFLDNLFNNTDVNFSLFMIDNGSSDGTQEYLKDFFKNKNNTTLFLGGKNLGVIDGRNFGYELSTKYEKKSEYILILDNDQIVRKNWLSQHLSVLEDKNNPKDIVGVEAWQMRNDFYPFRKNENICEPYSYVGCGGSLIRRKVIEDIGLFDERFNPCYFEDPDFAFRAYDKGYKIGWNIGAKLIHVPHQTLGNLDQKHEKFLASFKKFQEKWKGRTPPKILNK